MEASLLPQSITAALAELYRSQGKLKEADEQYRPLAAELKAHIRSPESLRTEYSARSFLDIVESAGRFYTERGDFTTTESFYRLLWPTEVRPVVGVVVRWNDEIYAKTLLAQAPVSCVDSMIRILNSYAALLTQAGREPEAAEISHGVGRLEQRKSAQWRRPNNSR